MEYGGEISTTWATLTVGSNKNIASWLGYRNLLSRMHTCPYKNCFANRACVLARQCSTLQHQSSLLPLGGEQSLRRTLRCLAKTQARFANHDSYGHVPHHQQVPVTEPACNGLVAPTVTVVQTVQVHIQLPFIPPHRAPSLLAGAL